MFYKIIGGISCKTSDKYANEFKSRNDQELSFWQQSGGELKKGYINHSLVTYKPKANKKKTSSKALKRGPRESTAPARNGVPGTKLQSCRLLVLVRGSM